MDAAGARSDAAPRERELKLELENAAVQRVMQWLREKSARSAPPAISRSVYFDTADFSLSNAGIVFRIRKVADRHIQTIKRFESRGAGLFDRPEWESDVAGFSPDAAAARASGLKLLRTRQLARRLRPVFEVRTRRCQYDLPDEGKIMLTLDRGAVLAGSRRNRFCEIEIESLDGKLDRLFAIAQEIAEVAPLRLSVQSKSDRGYALLLRQQSQIHRARDVDLSAGMPARDAFGTIARECLRQLVANIPATLKGDIEGLHQMRVALRRLRACMALFADMLDSAETTQLKTDLRWIGHALGAARDFDVISGEMARGRGKAGISDATAAAVARERRKARRAANEALNSVRFRLLLLRLVKWIECGAWMDDRDEAARSAREQPVSCHAGAELQRRYRKLAREAARLKRLDPDERHELRIRVKRLRYAVEFFGGISTGRKSSRRRQAMLTALKQLQATLGALNDIVNRNRLLSEAQASSRRPASDDIAPERGLRRTARLLAEAEKSARKFCRSKPFWD